MTKEQEALILTAENREEMKEIMEGKLGNDEEISVALVQTFAEYDRLRGEGAFRELPLYGKLLFIYRHAMIKGYVWALMDVQTLQELELNGGVEE